MEGGGVERFYKGWRGEEDMRRGEEQDSAGKEDKERERARGSGEGQAEG